MLALLALVEVAKKRREQNDDEEDDESKEDESDDDDQSGSDSCASDDSDDDGVGEPAPKKSNGLTKSRCGVHLVTSTDGRRHCCCCLDTGRRHVASIAVGIIFRPRPKRATSPFCSQLVAQVLYSHAALTPSSHTLCSYTFLIYTLLLMHCTTHALFSHTTLIHRTLTLHS